MNAGFGQRPLAVQRINDVRQCDRLKMPCKKLYVSGKLGDASEPVEIAYMGNVRVAHHVIKGNHERKSRQRAHPFHRDPVRSPR